MKLLISSALLFIVSVATAQDTKVSTIDFVQIQNDNREETVYYYENNWLVLRKMAQKRGFIESYEIIEVERTPDARFDLILKTTYSSKADYDKAEERFTSLIEEKGPLRLMNDKAPGDFRKIIFSTPEGKHLF